MANGFIDNRRSVFPRLVLALACFLTLTSCLRIPAEALKLNEIVTTNIRDVREKHLNLVDEYFKLKIEVFDSWFVSTYEPAYKTNYKKVWDELRPSDPFDISKDAHRNQYVADSIAEYEELTGQINALKADLAARLDTAYKDMASANDTVGTLLQSAKALSDAQRDAWNQSAGTLVPPLNSDRIDQTINSIQNSALAGLTR